MMLVDHPRFEHCKQQRRGDASSESAQQKHPKASRQLCQAAKAVDGCKRQCHTFSSATIPHFEHAEGQNNEHKSKSRSHALRRHRSDYLSEDKLQHITVGRRTRYRQVTQQTFQRASTKNSPRQRESRLCLYRGHNSRKGHIHKVPEANLHHLQGGK